MATYYVNAAGSNTSPFDTIEKGATTLNSVTTVGLVSNDIVEVIQGTYTETLGSIIPSGVTVRSYSANTSKPVFNASTFLEISTNGIVQDLILNDFYIWMIDTYSGGIVERCVISAISGTPVALGGCSNMIIRNNLIMSNGTQNLIEVWARMGIEGTGNKIVNNTLYNGMIGIANGLSSNYFLNNIVVSCTTGITSSPLLVGSNVIDYNDVYNCGTPYSGTESPGAHSILTDPLFTNVGNIPDGFKKQSGSPCKDTGATAVQYPGIVPTVDFYGNSRATDMGFDEYQNILNYFSSSSVADGTSVTSYINRSDLVSILQSDSTDTYLDSTDELSRVLVFYRDPGHRQEVLIRHDGSNMSGQAVWAPGARDGTWEKFRVIAFDANKARHDLDRTAIGSAEDLIHDGTVMTLNT